MTDDPVAAGLMGLQYLLSDLREERFTWCIFPTHPSEYVWDRGLYDQYRQAEQDRLQRRQQADVAGARAAELVRLYRSGVLTRQQYSDSWDRDVSAQFHQSFDHQAYAEALLRPDNPHPSPAPAVVPLAP